MTNRQIAHDIVIIALTSWRFRESGASAESLCLRKSGVSYLNALTAKTNLRTLHSKCRKAAMGVIGREQPWMASRSMRHHPVVLDADALIPQAAVDTIGMLVTAHVTCVRSACRSGFDSERTGILAVLLDAFATASDLDGDRTATEVAHAIHRSISQGVQKVLQANEFDDADLDEEVRDEVIALLEQVWGYTVFDAKPGRGFQNGRETKLVVETETKRWTELALLVWANGDPPSKEASDLMSSAKAEIDSIFQGRRHVGRDSIWALVKDSEIPFFAQVESSTNTLRRMWTEAYCEWTRRQLCREGSNFIGSSWPELKAKLICEIEGRILDAGEASAPLHA